MTGDEKTISGLDVYPVPLFVIETYLTPPSKTVACADAVDPIPSIV